jgi:hypothetical protein
MNEKLNLNDLMLAVNIIDVCSERGAFKGNELSMVGQLREKFSSFIKESSNEEHQENSNKELDH